MYYGAAWYPEHWPEERWPVDLKMMRDAGMNVVRVAEFAWSRMEPQEGRIELDWLERSVDLAAKYGINVVLGTPTATPPAWLTQKYPEVLSVDPSGKRARHGARCHYNVCSRRYLEFARGIASNLARRFGSNKNVIGWQIDNEYWRTSCDSETMAQFQEWLKKEYDSLDVLNRRWTTAYWSQEYSDWSQIPVPTECSNPCIEHAFRRFTTDMYIRFQKAQCDAIRAHAGNGQWITHNMHAHEWLDWVKIGKELDLAAWDPYPGANHVDVNEWGFVSDLCRNVKPERRHWIMETQPGRVSWADVNRDLDKGETRNLVWHFLGHGAEAVLFWQWRCPLGGQEQYHGSIVGNNGEPRPVFEEIARTGREIGKVAGLLDGKRIASEVAVVHTYPDRWSLLKQRHHSAFHPVKHILAYYGPLRERGLAVDVVDTFYASLKSYRLVVAPALHLLNESVTAKLVEYVEGGGHLLLGARSGFKDEHNAMLPSLQPGGRLGALLGAQVEEYFAITEAVPLDGVLGAGRCNVWAEPLKVTGDGVEVLLSFGPGNPWVEGKPALVTRRHGKGRISYLGAWADEGTMNAVMRWASEVSGVRAAPLTAPHGVAVYELNGRDGAAWILNNCTNLPQTVALPFAAKDALDGREWKDGVNLAPRGVAVLTKA